LDRSNNAVVNIGTREEVGASTTGGERVWGSIGDGRAIFLMSLTAMAVRKAVVDGWTDKIGISGNAFGCWEEDAKGLVLIGRV
jgi:hypothetical protein